MFGFIIGAISAVGSVIGGAASAIGSICGSIGGAIMGGIGKLGTGLLDFGEKLKPVLEIINMISEIFGIKPAGEDPAELGLKAHKSDEKPEDYDSIEAYIDHLRNDIQLDKEEINNLSDIDKVAYTTMGSALYVKNMEEKYNMAMSPRFWGTAYETVNSGNMSVGQLKDTMEAMKEKGVENAESFSNYMDGKASMEEQMVVFGSLKEALHKEFPDLSDADLNVKATNIKNSISEDKE